ncbi:MAG: hypothetical protein D6730_10610 [Bacteroidetes bacterium]|nr:MAG: hypothetical protein D6730_10610 [Bacteroidota bacterium]
MKSRTIFLFMLLWALHDLWAQQSTPSLSLEVQFAPEVQAAVSPRGRLFIFLNQNPYAEPREQVWPSPGNYIFAKNFSNWQPAQSQHIQSSQGWSKTPAWTLEQVPPGTYYLQLLWDQDTLESRIDAPGNLYSEKQKVVIDKALKLQLRIDQQIPPRKVVSHPLVKAVYFRSDTLSKWWKKDMHLRATVLLPRDYEPGRAYPIRYNVAGYGGRYTRVNRLVNNTDFMNWWQSEEAPELVNVFLDGEGPFGDSYQMDSENSGPYGYALIHELIPYIEEQYRGTQDAYTRFTDGCSTGGWVSLALQLYYPQAFNGVFSYSPDAIEFSNYQLINIYKDENAYVNEFGYERPVMRDISGEPMVSLRDFIQYENVLGASNTYLNSGGQFSAHTALYSPKGEGDLPRPLFDPQSGQIDHEVAEHWKKYDMKLYASEHWAELGPQIQGKIYIWMGDMDHFYLNPATREFERFLRSTQDPVSDAHIEFSAMEGHCSAYSHRRVLEQIGARLEELQGEKAKR